MNHRSYHAAIQILLLGVLGTALLSDAHASKTSIETAKVDILNTYNFEPSKMSFDQQATRAPDLSSLWDRFSDSPEPYRSALRALLSTNGAHEILYCDGGMLLLSNSVDDQDRRLGLKSISRCSLAEIEHTPYFYTLHSLAVKGVDTLDLQFRILGKPKYSVFIVQHALNLGQDYAFLYPLLVQDEQKYVPRLIDRLRTERDATAQKSLVRALWYAATPEAEAALRGLAANQTVSPIARDDAKILLERTSQARNWKQNDPTLKRVVAHLNLQSEPPEAQLRAKRRERMRSISDEALYDLEAYTTLIYRAKKGT